MEKEQLQHIMALMDDEANRMVERMKAMETLLHDIESCDYRPFRNDAIVLYSEIERWQEKIAELLEIEE